jgi:phosphoglycolate phosphatase
LPQNTVSYVRHALEQIDKNEVIMEIMNINSFKPRETIYIGDMEHDIDAGKKAGVITVAVSFGYNLKKALLEKTPIF